MHGLVIRAFQSFLSDTFGVPAWNAVLNGAGLWDTIDPEGFDPLHRYDPGVAPALLAVAAQTLGRPPDQLLEDLGNWLVSSPRSHRLRRLLRFGGLTFADCLGSLDDLQGRARLAVPDLDLPVLSLRPVGAGRFVLTCHACPNGMSQVLLGLLRALADDYGALVVIDPLADPGRSRFDLLPGGDERLAIEVHDPAYHSGRDFELADRGTVA
jgi:hypothetical protein